MPQSVDPAVAQARRVVGLYGDPDVSWSIVLGLEFDRPLDRDRVRAAAEHLVLEHPHLGRAPGLTTFGAEESEVLGELADRRYDDEDPLVRVALREDGRMLLLAAHHGALDGLGMLGAAAVLTGVDLTSSARGIERTAEPTSFVRAGVRRVAEALVRPPLRLAAEVTEGTGDWLTSRTVATTSTGSGVLLAAAAGAVRAWNDAVPRRAPGRRLVVAMGLSRRPGTPTPTPTRDTAYVRLPADGVVSVADGVELMRGTLPEPAFPISDGRGFAARMVRLLGHRLGATLLVSNLGRIEGEGLVGARLWPVPGGPAGVAVGLATAAGTTTVTVRVRRNAFTAADAEELARILASELVLLGQ